MPLFTLISIIPASIFLLSWLVSGSRARLPVACLTGVSEPHLHRDAWLSQLGGKIQRFRHNQIQPKPQSFLLLCSLFRLMTGLENIKRDSPEKGLRNNKGEQVAFLFSGILTPEPTKVSASNFLFSTRMNAILTRLKYFFKTNRYTYEQIRVIFPVNTYKHNSSES